MNNKSIMKDIDYDMIRKAQETPYDDSQDLMDWELSAIKNTFGETREVIPPEDAAATMSIWAEASMRGEADDMDLLFRMGRSNIRHIKGYRLYNIRPKYPPSLRLIYVPLIGKFVGSNIEVPIAPSMRWETLNVLPAFDEAGGDDESARRCLAAGFCYTMESKPIYMCSGDWVVCSLSKVRPDVHFSQWVRAESGIRNPLLGLVKMLKTLEPKTLDNMIRFTYDFGTPKSLLGDAITHLDKFRTLR
jgi:hypothetical protein